MISFWNIHSRFRESWPPTTRSCATAQNNEEFQFCSSAEENNFFYKFPFMTTPEVRSAGTPGRLDGPIGWEFGAAPWDIFAMIRVCKEYMIHSRTHFWRCP